MSGIKALIAIHGDAAGCRCSKLMKRFVGNLSEKFIARHGGKYVDAFYVSTFMAALLILMVVNMLFLVTLRGDDGMRLTYTDAFW